MELMCRYYSNKINRLLLTRTILFIYSEEAGSKVMLVLHLRHTYTTVRKALKDEGNKLDISRPPYSQFGGINMSIWQFSSDEHLLANIKIELEESRRLKTWIPGVMGFPLRSIFVQGFVVGLVVGALLSIIL